MCNQYNGWSNYETWVTKLWMDNDNYSDDEFLQEYLDNAEPRYDWETKLDRAVSDLEDYLKDWVDTQVEELNLGANLLSDLLDGAISSINFREIARNMLEDIYEEESEEEEDE